MIIFLLTNKDFMGDNNQLKGIQLAVQAKLKGQCEFRELAESEFIIEQLSDNDLVLVAGDHGLVMANCMKEKKPNTKVVWSGHQVFDEFFSLTHLPDLIALPWSVLRKNTEIMRLKGITIIGTVGVAHCVNENTVNKDHSEFKHELPDLRKFSSQVGIVLAGDAPKPDKQIKLFTTTDAVKQASDIAQYLITRGYNREDKAIMITNGPRTGKHDALGRVCDPDPHRSGILDSVSLAFKATLEMLMHQCRIFFYDFQFEELKHSPSAYKPMIKQVADSQNGIWFVPSESTSMVTESTYFSSLEKANVSVVIYHPSSENETHLDHADQIQEMGLALDIADDLPSSSNKPNKIQDAATHIANAIYAEIILARQSASTASCTMYGKSASAQTQLLRVETASSQNCTSAAESSRPHTPRTPRKSPTPRASQSHDELGQNLGFKF